MNKITLSDSAYNRIQKQNLEEKAIQEDIAKKNYNFVQIEKRAFKELRGLIDRNTIAAKLLTIMAEKMNRQNALVCSYETLSLITGLSRTSLFRAVKLLKEENWIQVVKIGTANAYVVNSKVFWQSYGDRKLTVFNASIITSDSEQTENWDDVKLKQFPLLLEK